MAAAMRPPEARLWSCRKGATERFGLIVDSFAGGGGASSGLEAALGRPADIAINHSAEAIAAATQPFPHGRVSVSRP